MTKSNCEDLLVGVRLASRRREVDLINEKTRLGELIRAADGVAKSELAQIYSIQVCINQVVTEIQSAASGRLFAPRLIAQGAHHLRVACFVDAAAAELKSISDGTLEYTAESINECKKMKFIDVREMAMAHQGGRFYLVVAPVAP